MGRKATIFYRRACTLLRDPRYSNMRHAICAPLVIIAACVLAAWGWSGYWP